ncbi:hypothetical protein CC80DRAFT_544878 [Byssothecium circinans]|uniref:J domain-containing protein n=1 Tax=Byssothecium circinans TaxID=147558 RepID=A0A6A5U5J9_9PLEO|nr:hypothetical protein CC80DRAFT_544878 [Byssothecium circinans]
MPPTLPKDPTYYEILEIKPTAIPQVIGKQYKKMKHIYDPSRLDQPLTQRRLKELSKAVELAYKVLLNKETRAEYDRFLAAKSRADRPFGTRTPQQAFTFKDGRFEIEVHVGPRFRSFVQDVFSNMWVDEDRIRLRIELEKVDVAITGEAAKDIHLVVNRTPETCLVSEVESYFKCKTSSLGLKNLLNITVIADLTTGDDQESFSWEFDFNVDTPKCIPPDGVVKYAISQSYFFPWIELDGEIYLNDGLQPQRAILEDRDMWPKLDIEMLDIGDEASCDFQCEAGTVCRATAFGFKRPQSKTGSDDDESRKITYKRPTARANGGIPIRPLKRTAVEANLDSRDDHPSQRPHLSGGVHPVAPWNNPPVVDTGVNPFYNPSLVPAGLRGSARSHRSSASGNFHPQGLRDHIPNFNMLYRPPYWDRAYTKEKVEMGLSKR